jgi:surface polysaccharide O-acyltransferase-like enzyme
MSISKENNFEWIDNLRVIATLAVIVIHVAANAVSSYNFFGTSIWWSANIVDGALRFCVPIFVMISGALLLPKEYELSTFLNKRLMRIVLPFLFWTVIYLLSFIIVKVNQGQHLSVSNTCSWAYALFQKGVSYHLWYVYMIIGLYLFVPIIGRWARTASEKEILFFLSIWVITLLLKYPLLSDYKINIELSYFTGYLGYLVLGYHLSTKTFSHLLSEKTIAVGLIIIGASITILGNYFFMLANNKYELNAYFSYLGFNIFVLSTGVFLLLKNLPIRSSLFASFRNTTSKYSYGIYLSHVFVLSALSRYAGVHWMFINPYVGIFITSVLCFIISLGLVYLINKMPFGKHISG